ncbi:hypothetical protein NQZ68_007282 [Dissostichus eleginoides]|nr:hypothetical protein NQZ68_007282 [Dissostichus eleginoides]
MLLNYISHETLSFSHWVFGDIPAHLVDYGRSVLIDVSSVQSGTARRCSANPVAGGRGLCVKGQVAMYHGGSVGRLWP